MASYLFFIKPYCIAMSVWDLGRQEKGTIPSLQLPESVVYIYYHIDQKLSQYESSLPKLKPKGQTK